MADDLEQSDPTLPIERRERDDRIQEALDSLAPTIALLVVMKEFDGLRYEEIAATLNIRSGRSGAGCTGPGSTSEKSSWAAWSRTIPQPRRLDTPPLPSFDRSES